MKQPNEIRMDELVPASALHITVTGSTKETNWPSAIATTFNIDFTDAMLSTVIEQAVQNMKVSARPALKKAGFDALKANPTCTIKVSEIGTRTGGITAASMIARLAAKAAAGTLTREDTAALDKKARAVLIKALSAE